MRGVILSEAKDPLASPVILSAAKDLKMGSLRSFAVVAAQDDVRGGSNRSDRRRFLAVVAARNDTAGGLSSR